MKADSIPAAPEAAPSAPPEPRQSDPVHVAGGSELVRKRAHSNEAAPVHEAWWLIEAVAPPRPLYFAGLRRATEAKRPHQAVTTEDASGAVRYPTEDTAKLAVAQMIGADTSNHLWPLLVANSAWKVAEHIFDYTPPAAPAQLLDRPPMADVECWERGLPDSIDRAMAQEAKEVADLLAMTEPEIDAELRQHGIDPDEAAAQGKRAVQGALDAFAARHPAQPAFTLMLEALQHIRRCGRQSTPHGPVFVQIHEGSATMQQIDEAIAAAVCTTFAESSKNGAKADAGEATAEQWLLPADMSALTRFCETCEDGQPYDVGKAQMKRLSELGVIQWCGASRYSITAFGQFVLDLLPEGWPRRPLKTHSDHDAYTATTMRDGGAA